MCLRGCRKVRSWSRVRAAGAPVRRVRHLHSQGRNTGGTEYCLRRSYCLHKKFVGNGMPEIACERASTGKHRMVSLAQMAGFEGLVQGPQHKGSGAECIGIGQCRCHGSIMEVQAHMICPCTTSFVYTASVCTARSDPRERKPTLPL